ncbi:MAG TPA: alpha/beta hydrolase [Candidatus Hydrogenedentes bacterium]|nr:alpha/beta hydrolase [Candidatus Hydrogenedentota bacterium]
MMCTKRGQVRITLFLGAVCALVTAAGTAAEIDLGRAAAPPLPKGYESSAKVMAGIAAGELKTVNLAPAEMPEGTELRKDIVYGEGGGQPLKLDLYLPANREKPVPGLVFIHGGAWAGGRKEDYFIYCKHFVAKGYVCAAVQYRLISAATWPAQIEDVKCAVRWLRANAAEYNVDPNRIGVAGYSAGAHLAMMVGYSSDVPELEGDGGHAGVRSGVQAVINFYGPTDFTAEDVRDIGALRNLMGGKTYQEATDLYVQGSPLSYVTADDPPTLIFHGTIDDVVPISQADSLAKRLDAAGVPYFYDRMEGWPHVMDLAADVHERCLYFEDKFLEKYLPLVASEETQEGTE